MDRYVGQLLGGQYQVLEKIGEGGMGAVYLVEHTLLRKRFAAKVLTEDTEHEPSAIARFELEAIAASRLDHDNIINVVNFGRSEDGTVFLIMELLRGETLNRAISRGPLALDDVVRVGVQICRALDAAHGAEIVHRDLKPENVFVSRRSGGRHVLKLLDFGISKIKETRLAQARLTHTGEVLGSPLYMSPEASRGELDVDARADLYAVGVILYEMVTGEVPFTASNFLIILQLHIAEPAPSPRALRPDLPPGLERVILRALAKDPAARPQSASELEAELREAHPVDIDAPLGFAAGGEAVGDTPTPRRSIDRARRTTGRPRTNLTAAPNRFIGRPREVAEVTALVASARLVTLTGTGGAGKTRLATEIAERALPDLDHGAWLVELAALRSAARLGDTIAQALGLPPHTALPAALAGRRMLIVLDNCEHLIAACASVVEVLLRECPLLRVLATSREPLGIAGETLYRVPPLDVVDAVQLFVERAHAAAPGFAPSATGAQTIAEICARLDGLPLALELAAARVRTLSVEELHARLGDRFKLLTGGSRTALPRQQTLRALIDWSHDLLDEPARVLLRRLAVFAGDFGLAQAEAVVAAPGVEPADVLDLLCGLVDRSLVVAETRGPSTRYHLLETIRQYAGERLDQAGETAPLRLRHRDELRRRAEELCARYADSTEDAAWFELLTAEHDNLREAIRTSLDLDDPAADRFVAALRKFWLVRGHYGEAGATIAAMLARRTEPDARRLLLLEAAITFATCQLDYAAASALVRESLPLAHALGEPERESQARTQLAYLLYLQCRFAEADPLAIEAVAFAREHGVPGFQQRFALNIAGLIASRVGDHPRALALLEECRDDTALAGGRQYHANVLESLATGLWLCDGHHQRALPLYREALEIFTAVGDRQAEVQLCERFAQVAAAGGQLATAARLIAATTSLRERRGTPREPIDLLDLAPVMAALANLPLDARAAANAEGRVLPFGAVLALARALSEPGGA